jgi:glycosyltransferase involved in cell wall biosynthesis
LKINLFSYVFWPEQFLVNEMAQEISKSHEVNVLTGIPNYPKGDFFEGYSLDKGPYRQRHQNVNILRYPIFPRKKGFLRLMLNYLSHFFGGFFGQYFLPKADWAFVFATSPITTAIPAILWAHLNQAKVCIWLQDLWPDSVAAVGATSRQSILYQFLGSVVRWIYKRTDLILIQSPGFADNLKEFGYTGPYYVVPNWAPGVDYSNPLTPSWLEDLPSKFTVTFAGNVGIAQAIDTVMAAAEVLSREDKIQFVIVGDGSDLERIRTQAEAKKLTNVYFYGRRPIEDMPGLFQKSDALLVSLKKDPIFARTIPSKVQAYMAAGKPLIGSLDGVGRQVIGDSQSGFSSPSEDSQGLAENILQMSKLSPEKRLELGRNAHSYFYENYRKDRIIEQIISLLEQH